MSIRLRFTLGVGLLCAAGSLARAQTPAHVQLMPQVSNGATLSVAFSPDGRYLLTGGVDRDARLWDSATGTLLRVFQGHAGWVNAVAISSDGRLVLTGSADNTARLWDVDTGRQLRSFDGHTNEVTSVAFSLDGRFVLTGSRDKTARLWDAATGRQVHSFAGHIDAVTSAVFSLDGRFVITGSEDRTARLWDLSTGQQIRSFEGQTDGVTSLAVSPDGLLLLTCSRDNTALLWNAATGQVLHRFVGNTNAVTSVAISPDGKSALTGSADFTVRVWNVADGKQLKTIQGSEYAVTSVAFSPDGRFAISGHMDKTTRLWDLASGRLRRVFEGQVLSVDTMAVSTSGRYLVQSEKSEAQLWDLASGRQVLSLPGSSGSITSIAISPDGRLVLTGSGDGSAQLWDAGRGTPLRVLGGHKGPVRSVAFSPDGQSVLTGGDRTARLWNIATGTPVRIFQGSFDQITSLAFSPDGRYVLAGGGSSLGGGNLASLWSVESGRLIAEYRGHQDRVTAVGFSPDGRDVLTGSDDQTARLWDVATGKPLRVLEGHKDHVTSLASSPDGRFILTGSNDQTVRLWDQATGQLIRVFGGFGDLVTAVAFTQDGRFAFAASRDGTIRFLDLANGKEDATLFAFEHGGWAVVEPESRYDSNDPADTPGLVYVTDSLTTIELAQLKDIYYTPNLLANIMKGERLPAVKGLDMVPVPPEVAIAFPYQPETKHLSLNITNQGGGVGRLVVSVNDRKAAVLEHPLAGVAAGKKTDLTVDLSAATLVPGENRIKVYAFDAGNQIRGHEAIATFTVAAKSQGSSPEADVSMTADYRPQFYGIVVGTASFPGNHAMDLQYPAHDAESMMTGLEIGAGKLFGSANVHLRLLTTNAKEEDGQPTKTNIAAAFAEVMKTAKPTDVLLVYLAGHGVNLRTEEDSYYYLTTDARNLEVENNPALRNLSTVSSAELRTWLGGKSMPLKEVLILDTCAAGAALLKLLEKRDVPPDQRRAVELLKESTGTFILMGSAPDSASYEANKYGGSLVTYALLEGMKGRSLDDRYRLNVSRWFQNASEDVAELAQSIGGIQKPMIAAPQGDFPLGIFTVMDQQRIPLASPKPVIQRPVCFDDNDTDPLNLASQLRSNLQDLSHPQPGAQVETGFQFVYLDLLADDSSIALRPVVRYQVTGNKVEVRLRLIKNGQLFGDATIEGSTTDEQNLAKQIVAKLLEMASGLQG